MSLFHSKMVDQNKQARIKENNAKLFVQNLSHGAVHQKTRRHKMYSLDVKIAELNNSHYIFRWEHNENSQHNASKCSVMTDVILLLLLLLLRYASHMRVSRLTIIDSLLTH